MSLFSSRLTLQGITSGLSKVISDLDALQEQNNKEISDNNETIKTLTSSNADLSTEAASAATVKANIAALLKTS